ncbi:MAG: hypothetical protein KJ623_00990 [Nanoarchaeota archaeon]|nr:hypothetical protein [Nanoarchaeota archaeon]MBU0962830.1 hypothetical protein [Nanoarchaeota archaeon]
MQTCLVCNDEITNPICINCLEQELIYWFVDYDPKLVSRIRVLKRAFDMYEDTEANCIKCGNNINVCSHCFLTEVMNLIKDENLKSLFKKSFISF